MADELPETQDETDRQNERRGRVVIAVIGGLLLLAVLFGRNDDTSESPSRDECTDWPSTYRVEKDFDKSPAAEHFEKCWERYVDDYNRRNGE